MKRLPSFGPVLQLAFVPEDFRSELRHWSETVGAGPFYVRENYVLKGCIYRGRPKADITIDLAIGYWGDVQIELIAQTCETPSAYREWSELGRSGVHHMGIQCEDPAGAREACRSRGLEIVQDMPGDGTGQIFYARDPDWRETMIEFIQINARRREYFAMMREAHRTWDGSEPIRAG
jgi:methylmalonyl-CoA/ethylmalonyl-CoA epimerase